MELATVARWCDWLRVSKSERTVRLYSYAVFRLFTEHVPPGSDATEEHVVAFLGSLGGQGGAKWTYIKGLRSFFTYAKRKGFIDTDPTADLVVPKPKKKRQRALTEAELYRLMCAAWERDPRRFYSLVLVLGTGARRMEAVGIEPDDIVHGERPEVHLRNCKRGKDRWVPLGKLALAALKGLEPHYNGTVLGGVKAGTLTGWAVEAAKDAGLREKVRRRSLHILRASCASHLLRRGATLVAVRDFLGHESVETTDGYVDPFEDGMRKAVSRW